MTLRVLSLYEGFFAGGARVLHTDVVAGLHVLGLMPVAHLGQKVTKTAKTTTMIEAALVIVPDVTEIPRATAPRESSPRSRASLILVRMKRW